MVLCFPLLISSWLCLLDGGQKEALYTKQNNIMTSPSTSKYIIVLVNYFIIFPFIYGWKRLRIMFKQLF